VEGFLDVKGRIGSSYIKLMNFDGVLRESKMKVLEFSDEKF